MQFNTCRCNKQSTLTINTLPVSVAAATFANILDPDQA